MIDFHTHPLLVREMYEIEPDLARIARDVFFIRNNPQPLETFLLELDVSGLSRAVVLPIDARTSRGCRIFSNDLIAKLCGLSDRLIGFCSVDPHRDDAVPELRRAVTELKLRGLKLSPPTQEFWPDDPKCFPIYEEAQQLGIPVMFHAGMSWEPGARCAYGQPLRLEEVAVRFPKLKIVIAHFAWPWVTEAAMLALKYPNIFIDTSCLYFDNPKDFIAFVMTKQVPLTLIEKSLRNQVVFGSNYPRVEIKNMVKAVRALGLTDGCLENIFRVNAERLLGVGK